MSLWEWVKTISRSSHRGKGVASNPMQHHQEAEIWGKLKRVHQGTWGWGCQRWGSTGDQPVSAREPLPPASRLPSAHKVFLFCLFVYLLIKEEKLQESFILSGCLKKSLEPPWLQLWMQGVRSDVFNPYTACFRHHCAVSLTAREWCWIWSASSVTSRLKKKTRGFNIFLLVVNLF